MLDFLQEKKSILYVIMGLLIAALIGLGAYRFFMPGPPRAAEEEEEGVGGTIPPPPENGRGPNHGGGTPPPPGEPPAGPVEESRILQLTNFPVIAPALNKTGDRILFYRKEGGHLVSLDFAGQNEEKVSSLTTLGLIRALHSPLRDRRAVFYLDGETLKAFLQIGTSTTIALPANIKSFSWSPDGKSIAYLLPKDNRLQLILADSSGKKPRFIYQTPIPDAQIRWSLPASIAFQNAPSGTAEGFLFLLSTTNRSFKKIAGPANGLTSRWSSDGKYILVGSTDKNGRSPSLAVHDARGKVVFNTGLQTIPDKCAFSMDNKTAYCAVPRVIGGDYPWPDGYLLGETHTSDRVVAVDIAKKIVRDIFDEGNFDMSDLSIAKSPNYLFMVDRSDGTLWRIRF